MQSTGSIVAAGLVAIQSPKTVSRVVTSVVGEERPNTGGGVVVAGCVAKERVHTVGRVVVAGFVDGERPHTVGRVVAAVVLPESAP